MSIIAGLRSRNLKPNMTVQPKGGSAMPDKGKYVAVFKRQADGSWKYVRDIWNSDNPMPAGH